MKSKPKDTKSVTQALVLAAKLQYDFGDKFYEPVANMVETGWGSLGVEAWAREHEVKRIEMDCRSWVKTAHYYSELGEIDTKDWFTDKQLCEEAAQIMAEEMVNRAIADEQHKIDIALRNKQEYQNIYADDSVTDLVSNNPESNTDSSNPPTTPGRSTRRIR